MATEDHLPSGSGKEQHTVTSSPAAGEVDTSGSQPIDYQALYEQVKDKPCRIVHINKHLDGSSGSNFRTRSELIERELEPIYSARTLSELHQELDAAGSRLKQLGIFSNVAMLAHEEPLDIPDAATVDLHLEELNWYRLRASTFVQGNENTLEVGAGLNNATGGAEKLDVHAEYGTDNSHNFSVSYVQPRVLGQRLAFELRGSKQFRNNQKASSFTEQLQGVVLGLRSMDGGSALEYELGWRKLMDPSLTASKAVRAQMGDYLKSCLRYYALLDRRDKTSGGAAAALGGAGWAIKSTTEVAGLVPPATGAGAGAGGSSSAAAVDSALRFVRQQVDAVANVPMDDTGAVVFSLGASAGLLLPWGDGGLLGRPTCIADRFFLGGPSSLRGFKFKGAGPTDERRPPSGRASLSEDDEAAAVRRDALGGDAYASVFASLMFQLPHPVLQFLKMHGHAFVNGGNVIQLAGTGRSPKELLSEFGSTFRWTCGGGLVLPTPLGRFEANYCVVLSAQEHDRVKRGLQLGFAASPLV